MLNFLFGKKENPISIFFKHLNKNQKTSFILVLKYIAQCDTPKKYHPNEAILISYFTKKLRLKETEIPAASLSNANDHFSVISSFRDVEKAVVIFALRMLANIDSSASTIELSLIDEASEQWNFDLSTYYKTINPKEAKEISTFYSYILFPNFENNISFGSLILEQSTEKLTLDRSYNFNELYLTLQVEFALSEIQNKSSLVSILERIGAFPFSEKDIENLISFLRNHITEKIVQEERFS